MALALTVLAQIMGGSAVSRLTKQFVEDEQIASDLSIDYTYQSIDPRDFSVSVTLLPKITMEDMKKKVFAALTLLAEKGVTEKELARAKRDLCAPFAFAKDGLDAASDAFTALAHDIPVEDIENQEALIQSVTLEQVNQAAKFLFSKQPAVILVLKPEDKNSEKPKKD